MLPIFSLTLQVDIESTNSAYIASTSYFCKKFSIQVEKRFFNEIISFETHSTANLPPLAILKKDQIFFKKPSFFQKNPNFERFEKSYYFSRILRQICDNLVIKKFSSSESVQFRTSDIINWQTSSKKNVRFSRLECMIFLPYHKHGQKITWWNLTKSQSLSLPIVPSFRGQTYMLVDGKSCMIMDINDTLLLKVELMSYS